MMPLPPMRLWHRSFFSIQARHVAFGVCKAQQGNIGNVCRHLTTGDGRDSDLTHVTTVGALPNRAVDETRIEWLRAAVEKVQKVQASADPAHSQTPRRPRGWLWRTPREVIDKALSTLPPEVQGEVLAIYEDRTKQHAPTAAKRSGQRTPRIIDDRLVSIEGSAEVKGDTLRFHAYDGSESTRLRFGWKRNSRDRYRVLVTAESVHNMSRKLAFMASTLKLRPTTPKGKTSYSVILQIVDGDVITGKTAERLRALGLTLRVVKEAGEMEYQAKRSRELERQVVRNPKKGRRHRSLTGRPKMPDSAWHFFIQDRIKGAKQVFDQLDAQQRQVYEDRASADQQRFQTQLSHLSLRPKRPLSAWVHFIQDNPHVSKGKKGRIGDKSTFDELSAPQKQVYAAKAEADQRRYRTQLKQWRLSNPEGHVGLRSSWNYFLQDYYNSAKQDFDRLAPPLKQAYEDRAEADQQRYQTELVEWQAATRQSRSPTSAFQIFQAEQTSVLVQQQPDKYAGRHGQQLLSRELRARWQLLTSASKGEYEQKLLDLGAVSLEPDRDGQTTEPGADGTVPPEADVDEAVDRAPT